MVLYTSTVGFYSDIKLIRKIKEANPGLKIAFVGPHGHIKPEETLNASEDIDFVVRGEFDHSVAEFAHGKPLEQIAGSLLPQRRQDRDEHAAAAAAHGGAGRAAVRDGHLQARFADRAVQRAVLAAPVRVVLYDAGMPGDVHVLHVAADDFGTRVADALRG